MLYMTLHVVFLNQLHYTTSQKKIILYILRHMKYIYYLINLSKINSFVHIFFYLKLLSYSNM